MALFPATSTIAQDKPFEQKYNYLVTLLNQWAATISAVWKNNGAVAANSNMAWVLEALIDTGSGTCQSGPGCTYTPEGAGAASYYWHYMYFKNPAGSGTAGFIIAHCVSVPTVKYTTSFVNNVFMGWTLWNDPLTAYPVGAIYQSTVATSPATLFGGTWTALEGRMLVGYTSGAGTFHTPGATGGAETHTLSTTEIPLHTHKTFTQSVSAALTAGSNGSFVYNPGTGADSGASGGGGAHNNLPPYKVVYMWERTA